MQFRQSGDARLIKHKVEWLAQINSSVAFKTTLTDAYPSAPPFVRDLFLHLKQTLSLTHQCTCLHTNTPTAYATFVTSHTSVISKDTKPTRSHTQFPRMQPKWSCKQALSLTGRKGTGKKYQCWRRRRRRMEGNLEKGGKGGKEQEVYFDLTHWLSSLLYNILMHGFGGRYALSGLCTHKCSTSSPAEKRHNGPSVLSTPGDTHTKKHRNPCQTLERLGCSPRNVWNNTVQLNILCLTYKKHKKWELISFCW